MTYLDGSQIMVGDSVHIEHGRTSGKVVDIHEIPWMAALGELEPGVMIEAAPFGLLYVPVSMFADQGLSFEARAKSNMRWSGP